MGIYDIDCYAGDGADYRGNISQSEDGVRCQYWTKQHPHKHTWENEGAHNFCRNPDGEPRPWCYEDRESRRWNFCNIRECNECDKGISKKIALIGKANLINMFETSTARSHEAACVRIILLKIYVTPK